MRRSRIARLGMSSFFSLFLVAACAAVAPVQGDASIDSAERALVSQDYAAARKISKEILARRPNDETALAYLGWSEFHLGQYGAAKKAFEAVAAVNPANVDGQLGLGWVYFKLGDLDRSERHFKKAKSLPADIVQQWDIGDGLGWIAFSRGDLDKAEAYFEYDRPWWQSGYAGEDQDDVLIWKKDSLLGRGWVAMWRNRLGDARDLFEEGLQWDDGYFRLYDGLARVALLEGDYTEALDQTLEALDRVRYDIDTALLLDATLEKLGDQQERASVYADLVDEHPDVAAYRVGLGRAHLDRGRWIAAEASFTDALKIQPANRAAKQGLAETVKRMNDPLADGWAKYADGDYEAALGIFLAKKKRAAPPAKKPAEAGLVRKALSVFRRREASAPTGNPAVETAIGWAYFSLGRNGDAERAFRAALKVDPRFASAKEGVAALARPNEVLYAQAWALADAGKLAPARTQFLRARKQAPTEVRWKINEGLAWVDLYAKEYEKAERQFRKILGANPKAYLSRKGLGYIAIERGDPEAALRLLRASFAEKPKQVPSSYAVAGERLIEAGQYEKAKVVLELGAAVYPKSSDLQFLLAKAYKGLGDRKTAAAKAVAAATLAPSYISPVFDDLAIDPSLAREAYLAMAKGLFFVGDNEGSIRRIDEYFKAGGKDARARRLRGFALFRKARYKEAIAELKKAAAYEPAKLAPVTEVVPIPGTKRRWQITYNARSTLAWAYYRSGDRKRAAREFRRALKDYPKWIDALTGLGYSLLALGDTDAAVKYFRRALTISPAYPDAWQGLDRVEGGQ